jgi:hypothetical protein
MSESENDTKGFKVTDRRKFTAEGEARPAPEAAPSEESPEDEEPKKQDAEPAAEATKKPESDSGEAEVGPPPEVTVADLVNMLATNALVLLGDAPDPASGERVANLQGAQVMIAFLTLLQEKTKGNLDKEEEKFLDDLLYNLRMRFLTKANLIK